MFKRLRYLRWYYLGRWWIKHRGGQKVTRREKIKIIIGSGRCYGEENGWLYTDLPHFNILNENDWKYFFGNSKIDNLLAEHVLEHLTEEEVETVLQLTLQYLKIGGVFRIAVPDGFHPNPKYIEMTKPPQDGHKSFWNYKTISDLAIQNGFQITLLEYFNEKHFFHQQNFSNDEGYVSRCKLNGFSESYTNDYTSLVLDLMK